MAAIALLLQLLLVADVFSANYSVRGTLTYEGHGLGDPPDYKREPYERKFEVFVDDCNWTIKMIPIGNKDFIWFLSKFDGTNIIYTTKPTPETFNRLQNDVLKKGTNKSLYRSAVVEFTPVPRARSSEANVYPWLAFASGCYFRALHNDSALDPRPIEGGDVPFAEPRRVVPCHYTLASVPPYLPIQIEYMWTNIAYVNPGGSIVAKDLTAQFKGAFLAAQFKSDGFTNVNGLSFPTKFEMREYLPRAHARDENDFRCVLIIRGAVTDIAMNEERHPDASFDEVMGLTDYRFTTNAPVLQYLITNGAIPAVDSPIVVAAQAEEHKRLEMLKGRKIMKRGKKKPDRAEDSKRLWVIIALGLVSVPPLIFLSRRRGKNAQNQPNLK